jgi:hypothetical protein
MPSQHKNPLLGWRPPAELSAWARAEAKRRGGSDALSALLTEALESYKRITSKAVTTRESAAKTERSAPHRCPVKGWCDVCQDWKGGKS